MKKTFYRITVLLVTGALLLSLSGCGALLNGDKQLTNDKLVSSDSSSSSSSSSSGSNSVNSTQATLQLINVYKLTDASDTSTLWITFSPYSSSYAFLLPLQSNGNNSYSVMGGSNSNSNSYRQRISIPSNGYASFTNTTLRDAYIIIKENNSTFNVDAFSNIIRKENVKQFDASSSSNLSVFTGYTYSSNTSSTLSSQPSSSHSTCTSSYKYLWVNLDNKVWVNLGNVYNN
ncbi:MAG: hypothetical protein KBT02_08060 [Treponema sp.]|nr:hypothetical protein [Candidatus Treponema caballi]